MSRNIAGLMGFFLLLLTISSAYSASGDSWLDINLSSIHGDEDYNVKECSTCTKKTKNYNGFNPGIGLSYSITDYFDVAGGGYWNSFEKPSVYGEGSLKYPIRLKTGSDLDIGVFGGVVTGYAKTPKDKQGLVHYGLMPMGGIFSAITYGRFRFKIRYVPDVKGKNKVPYSLITFQSGYLF